MPKCRIENEKRARQLVRFDGMDFCNKGFTDIDAVMDWHGRAWLMFEVNGRGKELTTGQRILAEHFVGMAGDSGRFAVAAVVEHGVMDCKRDVLLSECDVVELYDTKGMAWRPPREPMTAKELARRFVQYAKGPRI